MGPAVAWLGLLVAATIAAAPADALDGRRLHVVDGRLNDERAREITLRGVNARAEGVFDVTFDDGRLPLEDIPVFDAGDAQRMRALGFNLLRLPVNWSALEPQPKAFDYAYLERIAAIVDACGAHDILVLLDFHQDAFSKEIGQDGAPRWVLDRLLGVDNYPYLGGPIEDLTQRRLHPSTLAAFREFFDNKGGIQNDFAAAAVVLARRFGRSGAVLGYELMNEPLAALNAAPEPALRAFHVRVTRAIRRVDRRHFIVFEPDTLRNFSNMAPLPAARFPLQKAMYAPHIYTGVFDNTDFTTGNTALLAPSMERAAVESAAWGVPLLIGEWGIDPNHPKANEWITAQLDLQDRLRAHSTFWLWEEISSGRWGLFDGESDEPGGERLARTTALSRVYARAVPGRVLEHTFDAAANTLRLRYQANSTAPLELFVPARRYPNGFTMRCNGAVVPVKSGGVIALRCGAAGAEQLVELTPN